MVHQPISECLESLLEISSPRLSNTSSCIRLLGYSIMTGYAIPAKARVTKACLHSAAYQEAHKSRGGCTRESFGGIRVCTPQFRILCSCFCGGVSHQGHSNTDLKTWKKNWSKQSQSSISGSKRRQWNNGRNDSEKEYAGHRLFKQ